MKTEILYGIHPVYEALSARRRHIHRIYLQKDNPSGRLARLGSIADSQGVRVERIGSGELKTHAGAAGHQGVAARVGPYPLTAVSDLLSATEARSRPLFLIMLDNILDPQNLGAIIRTALCVGIDGVIMPKDRSAPISPAVSRASAGALEHIRLSRVTNLVQTIKQCKKSGLWIMGLDKGAEQCLYDGDMTGSLAIVLGGEQKGIRPLVKKHCDFLVAIPQRGAVDSLNVSVAAAVAMYEAFRQRQKD
ncbi:MAG: 23S rRNA (guanosine(2251)-2'-O)-methyltransferase RlmB [Deltaproteobacteria bacterium]|nr:23S rRNA (guanosine(2251)-2'-O)-methyltransferase RlmB [Deltaproteobacteria bacterium]MBW2480188.1 23S rRNA (guanosine(2251)-2'-O)-methyltransferase RlmB [Deltaproteobacteria bacterium]